MTKVVVSATLAFAASRKMTAEYIKVILGLTFYFDSLKQE